MTNQKSPFRTVLISLTALLVGVPLALYLVNRPSVPTVTMPAVNGYDTLVQAAASTRPTPQDYASTQDSQALTAYVAQNEDALAMIDRVIEQETVVPVDYRHGRLGGPRRRDEQVRTRHLERHAGGLDR